MSLAETEMKEALLGMAAEIQTKAAKEQEFMEKLDEILEAEPDSFEEDQAANWTVHHVVFWLIQNEFDQYSKAFYAALIDGETTLKRYVLQGRKPYLQAENDDYPDLIPARELVIQGVMIGLLRNHGA